MKVTLIETWGTEERIIESARMSTQGAFVSWEPYEKHPKGDQGLLEYLYKNDHRTPFEMCGATFEVEAPIFVIREFQRHRTLSFNEASARYAPLPDQFYVPGIDRILRNSSGSNRQAGRADGAPQPDRDTAQSFQYDLRALYEAAYEKYQDYLAAGVPKELARCFLPVGIYSKMRVSGNLRNWLQFLSLRLDPGAQEEIRVCAQLIQAALRNKFPRTSALFAENS